MTKVGPIMADDVRTFFDELREVWQDLHADFETTILGLDDETQGFLRRHLVKLFEVANGDPDKTLQLLMSTMAWMLMIGREHQARGYSSPVERDSQSVLTDEEILAGLFGEEFPDSPRRQAIEDGVALGTYEMHEDGCDFAAGRSGECTCSGDA